MSSDVILLHLPDGVTSAQEIPADYIPAPLGRRGDVHAAVTQVVPDLDLSDPEWGEISSRTWSIELNIGSEDPVDSVMLHIRGSGDEVPDHSGADVGLARLPAVPRSSDGTVSVIPPGHSARILPMHPENRLDLPSGRLVTTDEGDGDVQPLWLSDEPATAHLWTRMHAEHTRSGPCNYDDDTAKFSTVVRDWEHRFGARVVAVGFATLHLSVAAPPADERAALLVAAEH
ncbi:DUF4253 domain-containing protein [Streptomyces sp. NPDC054808]